MRGLTLIIAGMAIGQFLIKTAHGQAHQTAIVRQATRLLLASAIALTILFTILDAETIRSLGNLTLRIAGHPLYFIVGVFAASALTATAILVTSTGGADRSWQAFTFFGRSSLFTFAFGNILLYFIAFRPSSAVGAIALATALILAITILSWWFDWSMQRNGRFANLVNSAQQTLNSLCGALYSRLTVPHKG